MSSSFIRPDFDSDALRDFVARYTYCLKKWQKSINLVSRATLEDLQDRHFQDSFQLTSYIPKDASCCVDFGSGGGFPALPLAFLNPDIDFVLIESDERKSFFLETVSRETNLGNVTILNQRIEAALPELASSDLFTARAFASLSAIFKLICLYQEGLSLPRNVPFLGLKGASVDQEICEAEKDFVFRFELSQSETDRDGSIIFCQDISRRACE